MPVEGELIEEPIEILVRMAESGEIDPWNIDIVDVTDKFLAELERLKTLDLRISGRTLFFSATLLRMKSEYLGEEPEEDEGELFSDDVLFGDSEGEELFGDDYDDFGSLDSIERLEWEITRRIKRKEKRRRPVTLYELITELKTAEKLERRRMRRRNTVEPILLEVDDVIGVAHEEDFEDATQTVLSTFRSCCCEGSVELSVLCREMERDLPSVYLPLLFLMYEGELLLTQKEIFGEIVVSEWRAEIAEEL